MALRHCSEVSSQERSLRPVPGWAPERDVPSSQLLLQRGFDYIWRRLFTSSFGAAMSARPGRLMPNEGTRTGKGTSSPRLPAVLLPASPPTCLPLPDFFRACFLSAADSSGYDKQRASCNADHLRGCRSPPRCTAAHAAGLSHGHSARWARGGGSRAETPHRSKPAVPQPQHLHRSSPAPAARAQPWCSQVAPFVLTSAKTLPCFHQHSPPPGFRVRAGGASKSPRYSLVPLPSAQGMPPVA